jgi:hypothetical protein
MFKDPKIIELLVLGATTLLGGIVHATNQLKVARDKKEPFTLVDFIIL